MSAVNPSVLRVGVSTERKKATMANFLVTGGAGFIGSNIVKALLNRGDTVRVLDNFSTGKWENLHFVGMPPNLINHLETIQGDITDLALCRQAT